MFYAFLGQIGTHSFLAKVCATYVYCKLSISTLLIIIDIVISVFSKGDGKGSAHGWVPSIAVVTAASNVLLKIFALDDYNNSSVSFWKFWPKSSVHNWQKYQILPLICVLYRVDPNAVHSGFDMDNLILSLVGDEGRYCILLIHNLTKVKQAIESYEQRTRAKHGALDAMETKH